LFLVKIPCTPGINKNTKNVQLALSRIVQLALSRDSKTMSIPCNFMQWPRALINKNLNITPERWPSIHHANSSTLTSRTLVLPRLLPLLQERFDLSQRKKERWQVPEGLWATTVGKFPGVLLAVRFRRGGSLRWL
jgi:hypothetical protein